MSYQHQETSKNRNRGARTKFFLASVTALCLLATAGAQGNARNNSPAIATTGRTSFAAGAGHGTGVPTRARVATPKDGSPIAP